MCLSQLDWNASFEILGTLLPTFESVDEYIRLAVVHFINLRPFDDYSREEKVEGTHFNI